MASSHNSTHTEDAKMEQIITEFFAKSLHIILESRTSYMSSRNFSGEHAMSSPSSSSSSSASSVRPRDKWFNLALRECPAALENFDLWRQSNLEPMVVDVILVQRPLDWGFSPKRNLVRNLSAKETFGLVFDQDELGCEPANERFIERWVVQYDAKKTRDCKTGSRRGSINNLSTLYKKSILLLRSLYLTVRLLPAYRLLCDLNSSGQIRTFKLVTRVPSIVEPFSRNQEAEMQRFEFSPVDASSGKLCLSVLYRSSLSDISCESLTPMSPKFIPDYVGSPLIDPLRRFPSLPVSHGSPSSLPFARRHSWSFDQYKASPPSVSFSPSPTYSEPNALVINHNSRRLPQTGLPPHVPDISVSHKKDVNFDEYTPSPIYSPSPSPSPVHTPRNHTSQAILRTESAPVRIPGAKIANVSAFSEKQSLPQSRPLKLTKCDSLKPDITLCPAETRTAVQKPFRLGRDETREQYGVKLSSKGSQRFSFKDDFDDTEFPCPFDVEYDEMTDTSSRPESFDQKQPVPESHEVAGFFEIKKSQGAAVGALVRMLRKAPPLRQDSSTSMNLSEADRPEICNKNVQELSNISNASGDIVSSSLFASKTTADALEELRAYKEMKNVLLNQSGMPANLNPPSEPSETETMLN